jgi:hypothetical protein
MLHVRIFAYPQIAKLFPLVFVLDVHSFTLDFQAYYPHQINFASINYLSHCYDRMPDINMLRPMVSKVWVHSGGNSVAEWNNSHHGGHHIYYLAKLRTSLQE